MLSPSLRSKSPATGGAIGVAGAVVSGGRLRVTREDALAVAVFDCSTSRARYLSHRPLLAGERVALCPGDAGHAKQGRHQRNERPF